MRLFFFLLFFLIHTFQLSCRAQNYSFEEICGSNYFTHTWFNKYLYSAGSLGRIQKTDSKGHTIWIKELSNIDYIMGIKSTIDSNLIICGMKHFGGGNPNPDTLFIAKIDTNANVIWSYYSNVISHANPNMFEYGIVELPDSSFFISTPQYLTKYNKDGVPLYNVALSNGSTHLRKMVFDSGFIYAFFNNKVIKFDTSGNEIRSLVVPNEITSLAVSGNKVYFNSGWNKVIMTDSSFSNFQTKYYNDSCYTPFQIQDIIIEPNNNLLLVGSGAILDSSAVLILNLDTLGNLISCKLLYWYLYCNGFIELPWDLNIVKYADGIQIWGICCFYSSFRTFVISTDPPLSFCNSHEPCIYILPDSISPNINSYTSNHFQANLYPILPLSTSNYNCGNLIWCTSLTSSETISRANIFISPNPSEGIFKINTEEIIKNYEVYNFTGQLILSSEPETKTIDLSHNPSGIYFLKVNTERDKQFTSTLIKE